MRITIAILALLQIICLIGCASKDLKKDSTPGSKKEILVYSSDSASLFTYDPISRGSKQILELNKEIIPETFQLINDSLLTFTTLENMKMDSVVMERKYTDSNNVVQSYLSTTNYWVVTEKVHLISLSDGQHYIPQVNEYYVHEFQSQKFTTYGFPGILTFCVSDTVKYIDGYYSEDNFGDKTCGNSKYHLGSEFMEEYSYGFSESKTINGVKLITFRGNLILMNKGHVSGILNYNEPFSWKMETIGYFTPDISGNGKYITCLYLPYHQFRLGGIVVFDTNQNKKTKIADRKSGFPKLSFLGNYVAYLNSSRRISVFDLKTNTHVCIGEGQYYEWANK